MAAQPTAEEILARARLDPAREPIRLAARLRVGRKLTPFVINVARTVRYEFENPAQVIELEPRADGFVLTEKFTDRPSSAVRVAQFDQRLRDSDITYEDLSMAFLYWPRPRLLGVETVTSRQCWKIEIQAPRGRSQYGVVRVWIDQASGALLRLEGFDSGGRVVRRFSVISAQPIEGQWMLRQMRVESFDPDRRRIVSRTYIEVTGKAG